MVSQDLTFDEIAWLSAWWDEEEVLTAPFYAELEKSRKAKAMLTPEVERAARELANSRLTILVELAFGDDGFVVTEHRDGLITIETASPRLIVNQEQFEQIVRRLAEVGRMKGWVEEANN
jgi:hypothetical protein